MRVDPEVVAAVDRVVLMQNSEGYVDVLRALSVLMTNNSNIEAKNAAKLIEGVIVVLDEYLEDSTEEDEED